MRTTVIQLNVEPCIYEFYKKAGKSTGRTAEQIMGEILVRFAGEASLRAIGAERKRENQMRIKGRKV